MDMWVGIPCGGLTFSVLILALVLPLQLLEAMDIRRFIFKMGVVRGLPTIKVQQGVPH